MQCQESVSVLLVEDNPGEARLTQEMLSDVREGEFVLTHVETLKEAVALLNRRDFDAVLLDLSLPDATEIEAVQVITAERPDIPFVVLSGLNNVTVTLETLRIGAQDYLIKGCNAADAMARSILYSIERQKIQGLLREEKKKSEKASKAKSEFLANLSHRSAAVFETLRHSPTDTAHLGFADGAI